MPTESRVWIFTDNEGPCTLNDNAQENLVALCKVAGLGATVGAQCYARISNIDDIWGEFHRIEKDPSYSPGHTLKVVLPFYKALGANSDWLYQQAKQRLRIVPHIMPVLRRLSSRYSTWQVSTGYDFFIRAFCDAVGYDFSRSDCTTVAEFDQVQISTSDALTLRDYLASLARMPIIEFDHATGQVIDEHQAYYDEITHFVWEKVYNLPVGEFLRSVHPVGQAQKRLAIKRLISDSKPDRLVYIGDSITDLAAVEYTSSFGGLTIMFNGKGKVCSLSDIMYIGDDARAIEIVVEQYVDRGRDWVRDYYSSPQKVDGGLLATVTADNIEHLEELSITKRKAFRGLEVGDLS